MAKRKSKKSHHAKKTDRQAAQERAKRARKFIGGISDDLIKKAEKGNLTQEQFNSAVSQIRSIVSSPHVTGITRATPKVSIETLDGSHIVVKISISTTKTRKQFSVRRRL
jgi:hypothetical protein